MSKTVSSALNTHLQGTVLTPATCWRITRTDGTVEGFTDHDQDITIDLSDGAGSITYESVGGYTRSSISTSAQLSVDNLDVIGILDSDTISEANLLAGRYDFAEVLLFLVNHQDLTQGGVTLRKGWLGEVTINNGEFVAEMRGLEQAYMTEIVEVTSADCRADLGDTRCKVRLNPPDWEATTAYTARATGDAGSGSVVKPTTANGRHFKCTTAGTSGGTEPSWNTAIGGTTADGTVVWTAIDALTKTGTVLSLTDNRQFRTTLMDATGYYDEGLLTWTSGANNALKMEVKTFTAESGSPNEGTIELFLAMPFDVAAGDTFSVSVGCDKTLSTCTTDFDNVLNYRGEPHIPGMDQILDYPDAKS